MRLDSSTILRAAARISRPIGSGRNALEAAVEQRHAANLLQLFDLPQLREEAGFGGLAEVAKAGQRDEAFSSRRVMGNRSISSMELFYTIHETSSHSWP
jgi:hypothetical protein